MMINEVRNATIPPDDGALTTVSLAAGTSAKTSGPIDTSNAQSASIVLKLGAVTATGTGTAKLQWSDDGVTYTDVAGSTQSWDDTASSKDISWAVAEIVNPYMRVSITRATANTAVTFIKALISPRLLPNTQILTGIQNLAQPVVLARSNL